MTDIGTLGGYANSEAKAINNSGQVVGRSYGYSYCYGPVPSHAFLYIGGVMTDLGSLGGYCEATGINNSGQVVGYSFLADNVTQHASLYSGGVMSDLNALLVSNAAGWVLTTANAINDAGQIVGNGTINGGAHAFLLTPTSPEDECLFNWAEGNYPALFEPPGPTTAVLGVYTYRHYSATNAYLGVSSVDNNVYYQGQDVGSLSYWLPVAGCQASATPDDCLFNWAEGKYPSLFAPAGSPTATEAVYTYRHYSATNAYLGVSSIDNNVYYLGPDGKLQHVGPTSYWLPKAGCQ